MLYMTQSAHTSEIHQPTLLFYGLIYSLFYGLFSGLFYGVFYDSILHLCCSMTSHVTDYCRTIRRRTLTRKIASSDNSYNPNFVI